MVKSELIKAIAERTKLTQCDVERVLNDLVETVKVELSAGGSVKIMGFGEWLVKPTAARPGRNPSTNQPLEIPEGRRVFFKVSKCLKQSV